MATKQTILHTLKLLKTAYPDWVGKMTAEEEDAVKDLYVNRLSSVPDGLLEETADHWIDTQRFFPRIADLKKPMAQLTSTQACTAAEAWEICMNGTAKKDSLAATVFRQLGFDRADIGRMDYSEAGNRQARYFACFREAIARAVAEAKLPPVMRDALPQYQSQQLETAQQVDTRAKEKADEEAAYKRWFGEKAAEINSRPQKPAPEPSQPQPRVSNVTDMAAHIRKVKAQAAAILAAKQETASKG